MNRDTNPNTLTLCPPYFHRPHLLTDRVKGEHTKYLNNLVTRVHIVPHELLHADIIGTDEHIQDVSAPIKLDGNPAKTTDIYGVKECEALGASQKGKKTGEAVILAKRNADS